MYTLTIIWCLNCTPMTITNMDSGVERPTELTELQCNAGRNLALAHGAKSAVCNPVNK